MPIDPLGIESSSVATNDPLGIEKGSVQTLNRTPEWAKKRAGLVAEQEQLRSDPRGPMLVNTFNFLNRITEPLTPHGLLSQPNRLLGMKDPNTQINPDIQGLVRGGLQELENRGFVPPGTLAQPDSPVLGVAQAVARPADEMLNPETALVAPALMEDAGAQQLQQVLKGLFAGQIGSQIPGQVSQGQQVIQDTNAPLSEKVAAVGSPVVNAFMAGLIARDAMEKGVNPAIEGAQGILQRSGPGEIRQGDPALPFIARAGTRFTVSESGRTLDAHDPLGIESEGVKRASQQAPVVIGEQPQGTQIITPEMLRQSPTTVQPITAPQPPVEPSGGEISFRGQGVPSAGQAATFPQAQPPPPAPVSPELIQRIYPRSTPGLGGTVNITQPETGFTVEGFRPPDVKGANEKLQAKFANDLVPGIKDTGKGDIKASNMNEITHDDVLRANGIDPDSIPHFDSRRGFFDSFGRFYTRKEAERLTGIKGTARAGGLDSMDLPRSKKGAQDASRELRPDSISQTQPPGNIQEVGKEIRTGAGSQGSTQETKGGEEVSGTSKEKVQEKEDGGLHGAGETVLGSGGSQEPPSLQPHGTDLLTSKDYLNDFTRIQQETSWEANIKKLSSLPEEDPHLGKMLDQYFNRVGTGGEDEIRRMIGLYRAHIKDPKYTLPSDANFNFIAKYLDEAYPEIKENLLDWQNNKPLSERIKDYAIGQLINDGMDGRGAVQAVNDPAEWVDVRGEVNPGLRKFIDIQVHKEYLEGREEQPPTTKLYGGLPIFDPDLWMTTAEDLKRMKDKFSAYLAKKGQAAPEEVNNIVNTIRKNKILDTPTAQRILNNPVAKKLETLGKKFNQPGEKQSTIESAHNALVPVINKIANTDISLNPWDVIFDAMDGGKAGFRGPLVQEVRIPFDEKYQHEGAVKKLLKAPLEKIVKDNKFTKTNSERIATYLNHLQGYDQRMINSGVKRATIDKIVNSISPAEMKYIKTYQQIRDGLYPQIKEVAKRADGVDLKFVPEYFPLDRDFDKYIPEADEIATHPNLASKENPRIEDVLWPGLETELEARKTPGSLISRKPNAKTPIKLDAFVTINKYIDDAVHYTSSRELIKDTAKLVRSDEFAEKYGDLGQKLMVEYLNTYARQGRYKKNLLIDVVKRNIGRALIGARPVSQLIHLSNVPLAMKQAGPLWWERGLQEALSERGRKFIEDNLIETTMRGGGEPVQAEIAAQQARTLLGKGYNNINKWSFAVSRAVDQYNAQATALGVYMRLLKENGKDPNKYAELPVDRYLIGEARIRARRAVASPLYKDTPPFIARGGSIRRSFMQFQNVFLDQYSNLRYEAMQVGIPKAIRGSPRELMVTTAALLAMLMSETSLKHASKRVTANIAGRGGKEDDTFKKELAEEALKRAPGMGQLQANLLYGETGVPVIDVPVGTLREGKAALEGDKSARVIAGTKALQGVAELGGIPGSGYAGDIATALERRKLYKTHEQRLNDLEGQDVSKGTLQERVRAERDYKQKQKGEPQDREEQARAAERSISNITKRGSDLQKELDKPTQQWMETRGLSLPGYDNKLKISGVDVYLTDKETERLGELVKEEYTKRINQLKLQKATINKDVFNEQMTFARATARNRMKSEMEKSRSNNEQDNNKKRFSILPFN